MDVGIMDFMGLIICSAVFLAILGIANWKRADQE